MLSAPQQNSNITYVKRQVELENSQIEQKPTERESRIEKVPLSIPGIIEKKKEPIESTKSNIKNIQTGQQPTYNYSDRIYSIKTKPKKNNSITEKTTPLGEVKQYEVNNSDSSLSKTKDSDIDPAESILSDRVVTNENTGIDSEIDTTESYELVTEKYEEEPTVTTEVDEETTKAPSTRLLPKLSYFGKSASGSFSQNLIATSGKRKFRSRCRCEKIWNCAKLQITVPRCPNEYFLCCG